MTASKISRPNRFLSTTTSAATPRNGAFDNYRNPSQQPQNVNRTKRCLFGPADSKETDRLFKENEQQERQRCISRYGFDPWTSQPVRSSSSISSSSSSSSSFSRSSPSRDYSRPIDDSKKPYTRQQQQQQQKSSTDLSGKYGKRQC